ncbi:MAG: hypothetical protein MUF83_18885 [Acidimicrobiales bacterium]|nr:hypothetical protein [Acidimicrobiales bacterium]
MTRLHATRSRLVPAAAGALIVVVLTVSGVTVACDTAPDRSIEAFCRELAQARQLDDALASADPDAIDDAIDELRDVEEVAPTEIRAQVAVLLDVADGVGATLSTAPDGQASADAAFADLQGRLPDIETAGTQMQAYAAANCGVELNSTAVPQTGAPGSTTSSTTPAASTSSTTATED